MSVVSESLQREGVVVETVRLGGAEAVAAATAAGSIAAEILPDRPPQQIGVGTFGECCAIARDAARANPGRVFGAFKLAREFRLEAR